MKKVLFFAVLMGVMATLNAQLVVRYQGQILPSGDTVSIRAEGDEAKFAPSIENTSSSTCEVRIYATRCNMTETRVASICAGVCVSDTVSQKFTIEAGATYNTAYIDFYVPENAQPALFRIDIRESLVSAPMYTCYVWVYNSNTGIDNVAASQVLNAWPNPAQGEVTIGYSLTTDSQAAELQLFDMRGALVRSFPVTGTEGTVSFDVSTLPAGIYLYGVRSAGAIPSMRKLVVQ